MVKNQRPNRQFFRFLVPALLLACGVMLLLSGVDTRDLRQWVDDAGPWSPLAFIPVGIASMSVFVPKTFVSVTAGALFGTATGSLLMLFVAVVSAALNYAIGRWWLHETICQKLQQSSDSERTRWLGAVRDVAADAGFRFHFLIRLTPVPTTLISYTMGASGSRLQPFLMAAAVAALPQVLWVHGGSAALLIDDPGSNGLRWASVIASVLAALTISIMIPPMALRRVEAMKASRIHGAMD